MAQLWLAGMKWSGSIALAQTGALGREWQKKYVFSCKTWKISTISVPCKSSPNWARIGRPDLKTEQFQNTPPRLRDINRLLLQPRSPAVRSIMIKVGKIWIWNECKTGVPAVPHSRSGKKWIWNEYRTSSPAVPHSRSGKKWISKSPRPYLSVRSFRPRNWIYKVLFESMYYIPAISINENQSLIAINIINNSQ